MLSSYPIHHTLSCNENHSHSQTHAKMEQTSTAMNELTLSVIPTSVSANSACSYTALIHSHSDDPSPLLFIANRHTHNGHNRKPTTGHSISKSNCYVGNTHSMSDTKRSLTVVISPETEANNYKSSETI